MDDLTHITKIDIEFLLSLIPDWAKDVPKGLDPTMYGTGRYDTDLLIKLWVDRIKNEIKKDGAKGGERWIVERH